MPYVNNCPILALYLSDFLNSYIDFLPNQDQKSNFFIDRFIEREFNIFFYFKAILSTNLHHQSQTMHGLRHVYCL